MEASGGSTTDNTPEELPLCGDCYEDTKENVYQKLPDGSLTLAWPNLKDKVVQISDPSGCAAPWCKKKPDSLGGHSHSHAQVCSHNRTTPAHVCDCEDEHAKMMHNKILDCISKIEHSFKELRVAKGVTMHLSEEVNATREVDPSEPTQEMRSTLNVLSKCVMDFKLDDDKIETPLRRPLTMVFCPDEFRCHLRKISMYAPANCDCTPAACSCWNCVLHHVEHCVEDYEDAVKRARLGITKLQAMRPTKCADPTTLSSKQTSTEGCAMPGVGKSKHLKAFTKAQKDLHNLGK